MTREVEEEVQEMCNLGMAVEMKGIKEGIEKECLDNIKSIMKNLKMSATQAMDALDVPEKDREKYLGML